jgi:hypothetical protein
MAEGAGATMHVQLLTRYAEVSHCYHCDNRRGIPAKIIAAWVASCVNVEAFPNLPPQGIVTSSKSSPFWPRNLPPLSR